VTVGEPFNVDVVLTADSDEAQYASAHAELVYNPELVTPDLTGLSYVSEKPDTNNTLIITDGPSSGIPVGTGVNLATIPFTPIAKGTAEFSVSNATVTLSGPSESDSDIAAAAGSLNVVISQAESAASFDSTYVGLPTGYKLLKYELSGAPVNAWTYNGDAMHYINTDDKDYMTYIVADAVDAETASELVEETNTPIILGVADVNGNTEVRISDAQIVYDVMGAHPNYALFEGLSIQARLGADVNNDGEVTQADINAILDTIHGRS
jgi:hypothetical protein